MQVQLILSLQLNYQVVYIVHALVISVAGELGSKGPIATKTSLKQACNLLEH